MADGTAIVPNNNKEKDIPQDKKTVLIDTSGTAEKKKSLKGLSALTL